MSSNKGKPMRTKQGKRMPIAWRLLSVLLVIAIVVPAAFYKASDGTEKGPSSEESMQILGDSVEDEDSSLPISPEEDNDLPEHPEIPIEESSDFFTLTAPNIRVLAGETNIDLLKDASAVGEDGEDYSYLLSAEFLDEYTPNIPGRYSTLYTLKYEDTILAEAFGSVTVEHQYSITAPPLKLALGAFTSLDEIDFLQDVTAVDQEGNDVSQYLIVDVQEKSLEELVDLSTSGSYPVPLALMMEETVVATAYRDVEIAENGITIDALDIVLYLSEKETDITLNTDDIRLLSVAAIDEDYTDLNSYLVILEGMEHDLDVPGEYSFRYGVEIDGEILASATRTITILNEPVGEPMLFNAATSSNTDLGGNSQRDKLWIKPLNNGRTGFFKWMKRPNSETYGWVPQYYNNSLANSNGVLVRLGNQVYGSHYLGGALTSGGYMSMERLPDVNGREIVRRTYDRSDMGFILEEYISLVYGEVVVERDFNLIYTGNQPDAYYHLIVGGDTYFSGHDSGWSGFVGQDGGMVQTWRGSDQGMMYLKGATGYPLSGSYHGRYGTPWGESSSASYNFVQRQQGLIPSHSHMNGFWKPLPVGHSEWSNTGARELSEYGYHDTAYYVQWNRTIQPNSETKIRSIEIFGDAGSIQLMSEGDREAPPSARVTHQFNVSNNAYQSGNIFDVEIFAESSLGWTTVIRQEDRHLTNFAPGDRKTIQVDVIIPATDENGDEWELGTTDTLTVRAKYNDPDSSDGGGIVEADSKTRTIINPAKPFIKSVDITYLDDDKLSFDIEYDNVPEEQQPVEFTMRLQDEHYNNVLEGIPAKELYPGGGFQDIDISGLPGSRDGVLYRIFVEPDYNKIEYPHGSTTFLKGKEKLIGAESLTLTPKTINLDVGEAYNDFAVKILPETATDKSVWWNSRQPSIAKIDYFTGEVIGLSPGTATIEVFSNSNASAMDTATVVVRKPVVQSVSIAPKTALLAAGDTETLSANVQPDSSGDKRLTWTSNNPSIATVTASGQNAEQSNPQLATVTGVSDGIATIVGESNYTPGIKDSMQVMVDATSPAVDGFTIRKTENPWKRSLVTNQELEVTVDASDPEVEQVSSGVAKIYYTVVPGKNAAAPEFSPATWDVKAGERITFTMNQSTVGGDGEYTIFAVAQDKVGNLSTVTAATQDIIVDTEKPVIEITPGASRGIHALVGQTPDLLEGITATDNNGTVDILDQLVVTPSLEEIDLNQVNSHVITYFYEDEAGNTTTLKRTLYLHGRPEISAVDSIHVNEMERRISLVDPADERIQLRTPAISHYDENGNRLQTEPTVSATGNEVNSNILQVGSRAGETLTVTFLSMYENLLTQPSQPAADHKLNVIVHANGENPEGPVIDIDDGGVVTEPDDGDEDSGYKPSPVDPMDPSDLYRVRYYQNHGVIKNNGQRQESLTVDDLTHAITASNEAELTLYLQMDDVYLPLTDQLLEEILQETGTYPLVYHFTANGHSTYFFVYLLVNSDLAVAEDYPVELRQNITANPELYNNTGNIDAWFINHSNRQVPVEVKAPAASDVVVDKVQSYPLDYAAQYPYVTIPHARLFRVHGGIEFETTEAHIRVGEQIPTRGIKGTAVLAPISAGTTPVRKSVSDIWSVGLGGDINAIGSFTQNYNAHYELDSSYGTGQGFSFEGNTSRTLWIHGKPTISAQDVLVGLGYTKENFGNPKDNPFVQLKAAVTYAGETSLDIKDFVTFDSQEVANIRFGEISNNTLTFTLSDANAAQRPSGLEPMEVQHTINVQITDRIVGDKPSIHGGKDIDWIVGHEFSLRDALGHIVGMDNQQMIEIPVTVELLKNGATVKIPTTFTTPGYYTLRYTAIDLQGNVVSEEHQLAVYGQIQMNSGVLERDFLVSTATDRDLNYTGAFATYETPDREIITLTPEDDRAFFTVIGDSVNFEQVRRYSQKLQVRHPHFDTNLSQKSVDIRIHGGPVLSGQDSITVNAMEGKVLLLPETDSRFRLKVAPYTYFAKKNGTVNEITGTPELSVEGNRVSNDGILDISGLSLPAVLKVTFTAQEYNPLLNEMISHTKTIDVNVVANGENPDITEPDIDPEGPVTPAEPDPDNPGKDPGTDPDGGNPDNPDNPNGVHRINYYINHGVIYANQDRVPELTVEAIVQAVKPAASDGAIETAVWIETSAGVLEPLTESTLANALTSPNQRKIVYEFRYTFADGDYTMLYYTVYLRVNSDIRWVQASPIDVVQGQTVPLSVYGEGNNHKASYETYRKVEESLTVLPPDTLDTAIVETREIQYQAAYPYKVMYGQRLLRVHGQVQLTTPDVNVRAGVQQVPLENVTARVELAPKALGGTVQTKEITNIVRSGAPEGNLNAPLTTALQEYSASLALAGIGYDSDVTLTGSGKRLAYIHGNPTLQAEDMVISVNYTAADMGDILTNPLLRYQAQVQYYGEESIDLKQKVRVVQGLDKIRYGQPGSYPIVIAVSDQDQTLPQGLVPVETRKTFQVVISTDIAGEAPTMSQYSDFSWLQGNTLGAKDILRDVVAYDNNFTPPTPMTPTYTLHNAQGQTITADQLVAAPGHYTVKYQAFDSRRNKITGERTISVYGVITFAQQNSSYDTRETQHHVSLEEAFTDTIQASYLTPDLEQVVITPTNDSQNTFHYTLQSSVPSGGTRGVWTYKVTATHPVFTENTDSGTFEYRIHGDIKTKGFEKFMTENFPAGEVDVKTGIGFYYEEAGTGTLRDVSYTVTADDVPVIGNTVTVNRHVVVLRYKAVDPFAPEQPPMEIRASIKVTNVITSGRIIARGPTKFRRRIPLIQISRAFEAESARIDLGNQIMTIRTSLNFDQIDLNRPGIYPIVLVHHGVPNGIVLDEITMDIEIY